MANICDSQNLHVFTKISLIVEPKKNFAFEAVDWRGNFPNDLMQMLPTIDRGN